jgi:hypothetical protein
VLLGADGRVTEVPAMSLEPWRHFVASFARSGTLYGLAASAPHGMMAARPASPGNRHHTIKTEEET